MFLKSLNFKNFRNYKTISHKFSNKITILVGDNAQGKSNFLESIYFLAAAKSPKAERDEELIRSGEDVLRVEGVVQRSDFVNQKSEIVNLVVAMQLVEGPPAGRQGKLKKRVEVNGIPRRVSDYSENLAVIEFAPEDINMVTGSPSLRRDHIDQVISQVDRYYKKLVSNYEHIITRKNRVLKAIKEGISKVSELTYWSDQQIVLGTQITKCRREFFEYLENAEKKFGDFKYEYLPSLVTEVRLSEYQQREIEATVSLVGPHRDDFSFVIPNVSEESLTNVRKKISGTSPEILRSAQDDKKNSQNDNMRDLSKYGSRGEQRTAVLDLKIAEVSFMEAKLGSRPVLLLDDIFSELDLIHKQHVVDLAKLQQTIITTVELESFLKKAFREAVILKVDKGKLSVDNQ